MEFVSLFLGNAYALGLGLALLGIVVLLWLPRVFFMSKRCAANYRRWMRDLGLTEVSREDRMLFKGPFFGSAGFGHVVFRGVFRDQAGSVRKAFLRCGDHARGLLGRHEIEVRWDDARG
jgi:hypothetical protein